jgi:hypothetical protein
MSQEFYSAMKGSGIGTIIGLGFGLATLSTIGFERLTLFEDALLASCSVFGGVLFGALIGVTGAFRKASPKPAVRERSALHSPRVA